MVACAKQKFWERLCRALGRDDLVADARFATFAGRNEHREELLGELYAAFASRRTDELIDAA